ncbi:MAG TPA: ABC transporter permease [Chloroflexia bacterium]|nr:ABC transporter permease [Chloroflexia bacterium]
MSASTTSPTIARTDLDVSTSGRARLAPSGQWAVAWRHFRRRRMGMVGLVMLVTLVLMAIFVPVLSPFDWQATNTATMWNQPAGTVDPEGRVHWLGTTERGADLLELLFVALRTTLVVALPAALLSVLIGSALGAVAGYYGGLLDAIVMRVTDLLLAIPALPAYVILGQYLRWTVFRYADLGSGSDSMSAWAWATLSVTVMVFTLLGWMGVCRLVRAQVLSLRQQAFIEAARALGASNRRIIFRHLLPNALAPILVASIFLVGEFMIALSILSYIDIGVNEGTFSVNNGTGGQPSLGSMLALSNYTGSTWFLANLNPLESMRAYTIILPCLLLLLIVLSINYIGDAARYALDPHRQS